MPLYVDKISTGNVSIGQSEITENYVFMKPDVMAFETNEFLLLGNPGENKNSTHLQRANSITLKVNVNQYSSRLDLEDQSSWSVTNTITDEKSRILLNPTEMYLETLTLVFKNLPTYADNVEAVSDGYPVEGVYKTSTGELRIVV